MRVYEIILDGELAADLTESPVPLQRRNTGGATVLTFPVGPDDTLFVADGFNAYQLVVKTKKLTRFNY